MGLFLFCMFVGAMISASVASSKNRNVIGWLFCGALFPLISVIAILCLPPAAAPEELTPTT